MTPGQLDGIARQAAQWLRDGHDLPWVLARLTRKHRDVPRAVLTRWLDWALTPRKAHGKLAR